MVKYTSLENIEQILNQKEYSDLMINNIYAINDTVYVLFEDNIRSIVINKEIKKVYLSNLKYLWKHSDELVEVSIPEGRTGALKYILAHNSKEKGLAGLERFKSELQYIITAHILCLDDYFSIVNYDTQKCINILSFIEYLVNNEVEDANNLVDELFNSQTIFKNFSSYDNKKIAIEYAEEYMNNVRKKGTAGTVVITGCNRGLGEGIAQVLLENNYKVIGLNRSRTLNKFMIANKNYIEYKCDVSDKSDILFNYEINEPIDLLILNAGIRRFDYILDLDTDDWDNSVNTNLNGVFYTIKAMLPKVKRAKGDIVIIGSHSEKYTFEGGSAYCSTKGALKELAECLMQEVRYDDIRVSYLSLGSIKNRDHGIDEEWKLKPTEVGQTILNIVTLPKNVMLPYVDIRPSKPLKDERPGIEKLQYV